MVALARPFPRDPSSWNQVIPLTDLSPSLDQAVDRLHELSLLGDDWDGYGSPRITTSARETAFALLSTMRSYAAMPSMQLNPVSGGGLQFAWEFGPRGLEVEVLPNGCVEVLAVDGDQMTEGALEDPRRMLELLQWLLRS